MSVLLDLYLGTVGNLCSDFRAVYWHTKVYQTTERGMHGVSVAGQAEDWWVTGLPSVMSFNALIQGLFKA